MSIIQNIENEGRQLRSALYITFSITAVLWVLWGCDMLFHLDLPQYGLVPRSVQGLRGIIFMPYIHDNRNIAHILNNTLPFMVLFFVLLNTYRQIGMMVFILIQIVSGILLWLLGPPNSIHVGMSGVIFGMAAFLVGSGLFRRNLASISIAIFVIFFYGGMVVGFKPQDGISWEGHICGAVAGLFLSFNFRNFDRKTQVPSVEDREDDRHFFDRHP